MRLAAQKRERKQQRRQTVVQGAVEESGVDVPTGNHGPTLASERFAYKRLIQIPLLAALCSSRCAVERDPVTDRKLWATVPGRNWPAVREQKPRFLLA